METVFNRGTLHSLVEFQTTDPRVIRVCTEGLENVKTRVCIFSSLMRRWVMLFATRHRCRTSLSSSSQPRKRQTKHGTLWLVKCHPWRRIRTVEGGRPHSLPTSSSFETIHVVLIYLRSVAASRSVSESSESEIQIVAIHTYSSSDSTRVKQSSLKSARPLLGRPPTILKMTSHSIHIKPWNHNI